MAASPYLLLLPLAFTHLPARVLVPAVALASALTTLGWVYLIRRLGLMSVQEVPLLHQSRHGPVRLALRYLAPES